MDNISFVLASKSPRREELLKSIGINAEIVPANVNEDLLKGLPPKEMVTELAMLKASEVAKLCSEDSVVIGADTCVCLDGEIFGKPKDEEDAKRMLLRLSGNTHEVYTGYCVVNCKDGVSVAKYEKTLVTFRELNGDEIDEYIKSREPMDKAGAYGIQEQGSRFVEKTEGDYSNVVGLPLNALVKLLKEEFDIVL